jgi:hypothetical protein
MRLVTYDLNGKWRAGVLVDDKTIIATGTPEGVGFKRTPPIFLNDGDVVEVEVEKIGILRYPVIKEKQFLRKEK